jgi:hypothetical protein
MTFQSRIQVHPNYIKALGTAFYNFTYLEWIVMWTIVKLSESGFEAVPRGQTASFVAKAWAKAIETSPQLSGALRTKLAHFHQCYVKAIKHRNKLLHAHPYTTSGGAQQLMASGGLEWPIETVENAARFFDTTAVEGSELFHGSLKQERP